MTSYLRFLGKNKLYTAIMAVGLSVSLAFVIIFTCYVRQQMAVCNHYPDSDRIYLVGMFYRSYSYYSLAHTSLLHTKAMIWESTSNSLQRPITRH